MRTKSWNELKLENFSDDEIDEIRRAAVHELFEMELGKSSEVLEDVQEELASRTAAAGSPVSNSDDEVD